MTPFHRYILLFECDEDFFECHEVLEEAWQDGGRSNTAYAFLIQYAVAHYHARRGNDAGAEKSVLALKRKLPHATEQLQTLGLDVSRLSTYIDAFPVRYPDVPLQDDVRHHIESLKPLHPPCQLPESVLHHKHVRRDRSDVIAERSAALARKRQQT